MESALRTLVLFALAGALVSVAAWATAMYLDARRRLRRALKRVLGREPEAEIIAPHQGRAIGIDFEHPGLAALWDRGATGLVYRFEEIEGAELIVDGEVRARVRRDEPSRPLDQLDPLAEQVVLRFVFNTPRWPEFELDLHEHSEAGRGRARRPPLARPHPGRAAQDATGGADPPGRSLMTLACSRACACRSWSWDRACAPPPAGPGPRRSGRRPPAPWRSCRARPRPAAQP